MHLGNVAQMNDDDIGMDVIIISTSSVEHQNFWKERLKLTQPYLCKKDSIVLVVHEDWKNGAGNALGTLYAYQQASDYLKIHFDLELDKLQQQGASIAIYHTAGLGKRLWPLAGSEKGNKSAVKLPGLISSKLPHIPITILEAVIKQTSLFAPTRSGRLSVFWGDQVFIPSEAIKTPPFSHVDVLVKQLPFPTQVQWEERHLENYGLHLNGKLLDKISYDGFLKLCENENPIELSLGCFSLSHQMTVRLLDLFAVELEQKNVSLDSDPHLWMALTLHYPLYQELIWAKGFPHSFVEAHYSRMQAFKAQFTDEPFFSVVDIGAGSYWWDYGTIQSYYRNNMKLLEDNEESQVMRSFYRIADSMCEKRSRMIVVNSQMEKSHISNSIVMGSRVQELTASDSLVLEVSCPRLDVQQGVAYHLHDERAVALDAHQVKADVVEARFTTDLGRDGKADWDHKLADNPQSYAAAFEARATLSPLS